MPDEIEETAEAGAEGAAETESVDTTPEAEPVEQAPAEEPIELTDEYVKKLRAEAADYRTKLKPYEETFGGFDENERSALLDLARTLRTSPKDAAAWMEQVVARIKEAYPDEQERQEATEAVAEALTDPDKPLTRADIDRIFAEKEAAAQKAAAEAEAKAAQEKLYREIDEEIRGLGLNPESDDPIESADVMAIMKLAAEKTNGDIKAAHEIIQARNQKIIDDFVASKKKDGKVPGAGTTGGTPSGERTIGSMKDSKAAALERLMATDL